METRWAVTRRIHQGQQLAVAEAIVSLHQQQPVYQTDPRYMTFRNVWHNCLKDGELSMLQWIHAQPALRYATPSHVSDELYQAFANPNPEVVKWLLTNRPEDKTEICTDDLRRLVTLGGRLPLFQWLETNVTHLPYDASVMDEAASAGDLDLVQYLHDTRTEEGCTTEAVDNAAQNGHLDVVRFVHENRMEVCTSNAMDWAAEGGHLEVVRFLHENRTEGCTVRAIDRASNLQVLRFLLENRTEGCTSHAMDHAAAHGRLDIVRFLHENRTEGCTTKAMDGAAAAGHLEIVRF